MVLKDGSEAKAAEPEQILGEDLAKFQNGEELDKLLTLCGKVKKQFGAAMAGGGTPSDTSRSRREVARMADINENMGVID